jgi:glutaredoxin
MKQDEKSPPDPLPRQPLPTKPLEVTLYTRPGCHLCDEAKSQMAPLLAEFGARLREVNIDADPELRELYNLDVPVIFLADRKIAKHRVDPAQFRRQLAEARRRSAQRD